MLPNPGCVCVAGLKRLLEFVTVVLAPPFIQGLVLPLLPFPVPFTPLWAAVNGLAVKLDDQACDVCGKKLVPPLLGGVPKTPMGLFPPLTIWEPKTELLLLGEPKTPFVVPLNADPWVEPLAIDQLPFADPLVSSF